LVCDSDEQSAWFMKSREARASLLLFAWFWVV
jgi:hypothetical protein